MRRASEGDIAQLFVIRRRKVFDNLINSELQSCAEISNTMGEALPVLA
jgi:hypothetical protein